MPKGLVHDPLFFALWELLDYISPYPEEWTFIYKALRKMFILQIEGDARIPYDYPLQMLPEPFTSYGWRSAADSEKKELWTATLVWAFRNGFSKSLRLSPAEKYGWKDPAEVNCGKCYYHIFPCDMTFRELLSYLRFNGIRCFSDYPDRMSGQFERILSTIDNDRLIKILKDVTINDLTAENSIHWFEVMEVLLSDFCLREQLKGSVILQEYRLAAREYRALKLDSRFSLPEAQEEVLRSVRRRAEM